MTRRRPADEPTSDDERRSVIDLRERPLPATDGRFTVDWQLPADPDDARESAGRPACA
jgi:hypothetical protein